LRGVGAALVTPTTLAILSASSPEPAERARAVGAWSAAGAVAVAIGPLLGGILSRHVNWERRPNRRVGTAQADGEDRRGDRAVRLPA